MYEGRRPVAGSAVVEPGGLGECFSKMLRRDATVRPVGDWVVLVVRVEVVVAVVIGVGVGVWLGLLRSRSGSVAQSVDELSGVVSWLVGLCVLLFVVCLVVLCSMVVALTTVLELFGFVVPLVVVVLVVVGRLPGDMACCGLWLAGVVRGPLEGSTVVGLLMVRLPVTGCRVPGLSKSVLEVVDLVVVVAVLLVVIRLPGEVGFGLC